MQNTLVQTLAAAAVLASIGTASALPIVEGVARRSTNPIASHDAFPPSAHRRHHAKMAELSKRNISPRALLSNTGFGTLYYDINGGGTCGPANGWSSFPETQGYAMCEPWTNPKTLAQRGTNKIVALPVSMMTGNLDKYCGKEVTATYNGKTIDGLIAWDGCAACDSGNGIDFSSTVFGELVGTDKCGAGKVQGVTWQVKENSIWDRNGNPVSGGNYADSTTTTSDVVTDNVVESSSTWSSTQEQGTPIATTTIETEEEQQDEPTSSDSSDRKKIANMRLPILAVKPTTSSSEITEEQPQATAENVVKTQESASPSDVGNACNDKAGQWKCNGKALEQCIQDGSNWVWSERFECSVDPINCETANPVCPGKAVRL